jgi:chromosomal replication initiator protein
MSQEPTPTIDWLEARRLADQSIRMGRLILEAINASAPKLHRSDKMDAEKICAIIPAVARYYGYDVALLSNKTRTSELVWARHVAMFFCREFTAISSADVGKRFKRDHGSVLHGCYMVRTRCETEPRTAQQIEELRNQLHDLL